MKPNSTPPTPIDKRLGLCYSRKWRATKSEDVKRKQTDALPSLFDTNEQDNRQPLLKRQDNIDYREDNYRLVEFGSRNLTYAGCCDVRNSAKTVFAVTKPASCGQMTYAGVTRVSCYPVQCVFWCFAVCCMALANSSSGDASLPSIVPPCDVESPNLTGLCANDGKCSDLFGSRADRVVATYDTRNEALAEWELTENFWSPEDNSPQPQNMK